MIDTINLDIKYNIFNLKSKHKKRKTVNKHRNSRHRELRGGLMRIFFADSTLNGQPTNYGEIIDQSMLSTWSGIELAHRMASCQLRRHRHDRNPIARPYTLASCIVRVVVVLISVILRIEEADLWEKGKWGGWITWL